MRNEICIYSKVKKTTWNQSKYSKFENRIEICVFIQIARMKSIWLFESLFELFILQCRNFTQRHEFMTEWVFYTICSSAGLDILYSTYRHSTFCMFVLIILPRRHGNTSSVLPAVLFQFLFVGSEISKYFTRNLASAKSSSREMGSHQAKIFQAIQNIQGNCFNDLG